MQNVHYKEGHGVKLSNLVQYSKKLGYQAAYAQLPLSKDKLKKSIDFVLNLKNPSILVLKRKGELSHAVVFLGTESNLLLFADPLVGYRKMAVYTFIKYWSGHIVIIWKKNTKGNLIKHNANYISPEFLRYRINLSK